MLTLLDGTVSPKLHYDNCAGVKLIDEEPNDDSENFNDSLHDAFF